MMRHGYIGEFEIVDDHRAGKIVVNLNGRLNKCSVISPRFDIKLKADVILYDSISDSQSMTSALDALKMIVSFRISSNTQLTCSHP
ncbi:30S ribosomal protein S8P domain protein, partial [Ostertagia ostertagi]